ncbi:MAG: hypothetical protein AB7O37_00090 [Vicinamibacteria bacterium]
MKAQIEKAAGPASMKGGGYGRPSTRQPEAGPRLTGSVRWEGEQLVVEESGKEGWTIVEVYTLVPGGERLNVALRFEVDLFEAPIDLKLGYVRARAESAR